MPPPDVVRFASYTPGGSYGLHDGRLHTWRSNHRGVQRRAGYPRLPMVHEYPFRWGWRAHAEPIGVQRPDGDPRLETKVGRGHNFTRFQRRVRLIAVVSGG